MREKARLNGRQDFDVDLFRAGAGLRGSVHVSDRTTDRSLNADGTVKVPHWQGPLVHGNPRFKRVQYILRPEDQLVAGEKNQTPSGR